MNEDRDFPDKLDVKICFALHCVIDKSIHFYYYYSISSPPLMTAHRDEMSLLHIKLCDSCHE